MNDNEKKDELIQRQVGVTQEHIDWLEERCINLPAFVRKCLNKAIQGKLKYY